MLLVPALSLVAAVADWVGVARARRSLEYVAKPAVLMFLIIWVMSSLPAPMPSLGRLFLLGLFASLVGDILLMVPGDRFLGGLAAFLLAHLAYVGAFNLEGLILTPGSLALAAAIALAVAALLGRLRASLAASGREALFPPVAFYGVVLGLTLWSAVITLLRPIWPRPSAALIAVGGALFFASDLILAWNRFIGPLPGGRLPEHFTYHLAQIALTSGVLLAASAAQT